MQVSAARSREMLPNGPFYPESCSAPFIKRRIKSGLGFGSFNTARRTLKGYEAMNMIRKGQISGIEKGDVLGQICFINEIFGVTA